MTATISKDGKTVQIQLPVSRRQLAGALSYLGADHASEFDLKYNEENQDGLKVSLEVHGDVETAIEKILKTGFSFSRLNDSLEKMDNLPYKYREDVENRIKLDGLQCFEQFDTMLQEALPQTVTKKFYFPLTVEVHGKNSWGGINEEGFEEDGEFVSRYEDAIRNEFYEYSANDDEAMASYFRGNNSVSAKLISADWGFERKRGELYGRVTVQTEGELTDSEEKDLKDWIIGQNADGLGEGFEQQEIPYDHGYYGGIMFVHFWNFDDGYFVDNEDEFEERLDSQDITFGGM